MADLSIFSIEDQQEQLRKRRENLLEKRQHAKDEAAFYHNLAPRISSSEYGTDRKWDRTFGKFPVYVDLPGFGLCITTRGRWKDYQGRQVVHWGIYKINPFVADDQALRSEYYEIPTKGSMGDIQRKWVLPLPFTLLQFRLDERKRENSELLFCRAKDYQEDDFECKVMLLSDFIRQVRADQKRVNGYRVLVDALRMQFPAQVEKYMQTIRSINEVPNGVAHTKKRKSHRKRKTQSQPQYQLITIPSSRQPNNDTDSDDSDGEEGERVSDLNSVDKRIGWGVCESDLCAIEESSSAGSSVNGDALKIIEDVEMAQFIKKNSQACQIANITGCNVDLPRIPHLKEERLMALSLDQSRTFKLLKQGGDPTLGDTWSFGPFNI